MKSYPIAAPAAPSQAPPASGTQYLVVACNVTRVVTVDGRAVGRTDEVLEVPAGEHVVSLLAPPENFRPKERRILLGGTSSEKPLVVRFETR
ncbi:MAG TPA: hypothetical protein VFN94_11010 [Nitrospiria bacterium]|nr:hypothetical protein [Nitrospiria bacterium]